MIGDALIASVCISLLAGGRLANLANVQLRAAWLVFGAVVVQYGGQWVFDRGATLIGAWGPALYLLSFCALLSFIWINRHLPGFLLIGAGILGNVLVIAANGGHMPVSLDALRQAGLGHLVEPLQSGAVFTHTAMGPENHLRWLGDLFALQRPYPRPKVLSVGDIILALGMFYFTVATLQPWPLSRFSAKVAAKPQLKGE